MREQFSPKRRDKYTILKVVILQDRARHGNRYENHKPHENRIHKKAREIKLSIKNISQ
jgi:hypothetical protein